MDTPEVTEPILHVDMDCFFVSVERVLHPELIGLPVVVGRDGGRSVVSAASYEARAYGVHSAMPMSTAKRLCPDLRIVHTPGDYYQRASRAVMRILESFTPLVEAVSIDEAYLDVRGAVNLFGPPATIAAQIRTTIARELTLPASVGIAPTKQLAKLASNLAKPNGVYHIEHTAITEILNPLPIGQLHGVGAKTVEKLERHAIHTCADVLALPPDLLDRLIGHHSAAHLRTSAMGIDERPVVVHQPRKQISAERTFDRDLSDVEQMYTELLRLAEHVATRARKAHSCGQVVTLKVRTSSFTTTTRNRTLPTPVDDATSLYEAARLLLDHMHIQRVAVRLLGISLSTLYPREGARQLSLDGKEKWQDIDRVIDGIRNKYHGSVVTRGALIDPT
ncbi:DNA polymerase IV [Stomatohabitans albus]|uniref:DNA polymerase IV n=1 Tax=Stomatohabitans albus TaxID=3110766 RepID=UPI00300CEE6E